MNVPNTRKHTRTHLHLPRQHGYHKPDKLWSDSFPYLKPRHRQVKGLQLSTLHHDTKRHFNQSNPHCNPFHLVEHIACLLDPTLAIFVHSITIPSKGQHFVNPHLSTTSGEDAMALLAIKLLCMFLQSYHPFFLHHGTTFVSILQLFAPHLTALTCDNTQTNAALSSLSATLLFPVILFDCYVFLFHAIKYCFIIVSSCACSHCRPVERVVNCSIFKVRARFNKPLVSQISKRRHSHGNEDIRSTATVTYILAPSCNILYHHWYSPQALQILSQNRRLWWRIAEFVQPL